MVPGGSYAYTPFGVVASGNTPDPFGFTGELHSEGLVYLRARWYDPSVGTFTSRDPFAGFPETPYSLHPYQYAYSAPTMWTDAAGATITCGQAREISPGNVDIMRVLAAAIRQMSDPNRRRSPDTATGYVVGLMFWLLRNRLVGSYWFFSATRRA